MPQSQITTLQTLSMCSAASLRYHNQMSLVPSMTMVLSMTLEPSMTLVPLMTLGPSLTQGPSQKPTCTTLRDLTSDYLTVAHKALLWLKQVLVYLIQDTNSIAGAYHKS